jgi:hypothetical protein
VTRKRGIEKVRRSYFLTYLLYFVGVFYEKTR